MHPSSNRSWTGALLNGRYRVGQLIGNGELGSVYEAVREDAGRMRVAIKVLDPEYSTFDEIVARFRREASVVASLDHPNIVKILDFYSAPKQPTFLVMELLTGTTLAQTLAAEGKLSVNRGACIASQMLAALAASHAAGVIHRDLKPENVFLTSMSGLRDIVKLLDFGMAKMQAGPGDQRLTQTGVVLGTPPYMAPEYARGGAIDARADIYAVGCVLYEMFAGRAPFTAANYNALLFAIMDGEPDPLRELRPDLPPALLDVITKAMARDPAQRFQTAGEMVAALEPWIASGRSG